MPLYFAYGSNMHAAGLRARCPRSRALEAATLADHRFYLMRSSGYASVRPAAGEIVHGLLIDLHPSDLAALDAYEDVEGGLYARRERAVGRSGGTAPALVYLGGELAEGGAPPPGYMECVVAAAREAGLPPSYVAGLAALLPAAVPGRAAASW